MDTSSIGSVANLFSFFKATSSNAPATQAPARSHHFHGGHGAPQASQTTDDSTATLQYRRTERTGLSIVTQEGDVVRLRIKVSDSLSGAASGGTEDGTQVGQLSVAARSSVKISFHVDGDLNADELSAISDVVQQVGALADQFFAGDVPAAFAAAQDLNIDSSQLAKVGLRLSVRETATYSGPALAVAAAPLPAAAPTPAVTPALPAPAPPSTASTDVPAVTADPAATESDTTSTTDIPATTDTAPTPPTTDPAPAPTPAPPTSVAGNVLATIGDFLHQLLDTLGTPAPASDGGSHASVSVSLKLRIFSATVAHLTVAAWSAGDGTEQKAAPLVGDTLDALAAAHDPSLSTSA